MGVNLATAFMEVPEGVADTMVHQGLMAREIPVMVRQLQVPEAEALPQY